MRVRIPCLPLIFCLGSEMEIMPRFERGVLGSNPGRGIEVIEEGQAEWRREPVGSRSSISMCLAGSTPAPSAIRSGNRDDDLVLIECLAVGSISDSKIHGVRGVVVSACRPVKPKVTVQSRSNTLFM